MDTVAMLREALDPELLKLIELTRTVLPHLDGPTIGSLLILYGVEISLSGCAISRPEMAGYLRDLADGVEREDRVLPTLGEMSPTDIAEPAF